MAALDPTIRTVHLTRIPLWLSQESDSAIVVPGVTRAIERTVGVPTDGVTYSPDRHDDIRVQFLTPDSAEYAIVFYNNLGNSGEFSMEWSTYDISPEDPPTGPCPVRYRFPQRDIPPVFPQDKPPEPVHPSDPSWFCRYNPLQPEIRRQVHYMWSPRPQPAQNNSSPQPYLSVPPQPPPPGLPWPQQRGLPWPQQRQAQRHQAQQQRAWAPRPLAQQRHHPYPRHSYQQHSRQQCKPHKLQQQAPRKPPDLLGPQQQGP